MWKPASPIVIDGCVLTDQEVWWHEFRNELEELAEGLIDNTWLTMVCHVVYAIAFKDDPRYIAKLAYAVFALERPKLASTARREPMHWPRRSSPRFRSCRRPLR